jgi:hypothetical protein
VFAVDAVTFLVCAGLLTRLPAVRPLRRGSGRRRSGPGVLRDRPYALVALLNTVLLLRLPLLSLVLPLWITRRTDAPAWLVSALFVLNTGAVMLFQVRAARGVTGLATATRAVRRAGWVMLAACVVFALSAGVSLWVAVGFLVVGAVLQVVAEMGQSAGSWQLSFDLAPEGRVGEYQGLFGTGVTVARTLGPLLLTTLLVEWGTPGWLLLGGAMVVASYAMGPAARVAAGAVTGLGIEVGQGPPTALHRDQRRAFPPLEDLVEAHHRTAPPRLVADLDVVGELLDDAEPPAVLGVGGRRAQCPVRCRETGSRVGDLDVALLAVQVGRDAVRLGRAVGRGVTAVLHGVRTGLAEGHGEVVRHVGVDARGLHGADQQPPGERHARGLAPKME